ncbi:MAG TPA: mechanosensitive ion channel domain-containing protein [Planctomycetota bacterium]|nr:mechanosensitive ion channel domain-containing protein [Planctomycetota bacterium]
MDAETVSKSAEQAADAALALVSSWGVQVVGAVALLIIGRWVAGAVRRGTRHSLEAARVDSALVPFFSSLAYYLTLTVVVIAVLSLFGIETTSLVAVLGAAGLAVGLALQGTLSNFAAGVMLLVFRPVRIGDFVEVAGVAGAIEELGVFSSVLNTPDNVRITIPNSNIYGAVIKNYSINEKRRVDLAVRVSYGDDLATATRILEEIVRKDARVLADPPPDVAVADLAESGVQFVVRPWVKSGDYWAVRFDLTRAVKEGLEAGGCHIPFPQRDVRVYERSPGAS